MLILILVFLLLCIVIAKLYSSKGSEHKQYYRTGYSEAIWFLRLQNLARDTLPFLP